MYNEDNVKKWLWLTVKCSLSRKKIKAILETFKTIDNIYEADFDKFNAFTFLTDEEKNKLSDKSINGIDGFIKTLSENQVKILTSDNEEEYPYLLKQTYDYPYVLYCRGKFVNLNKHTCVAVVGARKASEYGINCAKNLSYDIAKEGIIVVSGMAYGIDAAAHSGALDANGITVAILGCGINRVYPASNANLMKRIMKTGMVISEYPPNTEPLKHHFPERNRIISGISKGTLVVEATFNSGSLITASIANETGRDVFAVPGNINSLYSKGTNSLIKDGAYVVTNADDILCHYKNSIKKSSPDKENKIKENVSDNLSNEFSDNESLVLAHLGGEPMHIDKILELTNLDFSTLSETLLMLELSGKIYSSAGNMYSLSI